MKKTTKGKRGGAGDPFHQRPAPEEKRAWSGPTNALGIDKIAVRVTKTSDGQRDYVQIMSADMVSVNIVLIADAIQVFDDR